MLRCLFPTDEARTFPVESWKKTRPLSEETDGEVFISAQSRNFALVVNMIEIVFPIGTSTRRVNNYVSRQGKGINRTSESTNIILNFCIVLKVVSSTFQ